MQEHNMLKNYKLLSTEILEEAYARLGTLKAVGKELGVSGDTIKRYMIANNLDYAGPVRYSCDHNFFSRDNEEAFYIAGFIAADGCVSDKRVLSIGLSSKDRYQLEMIKNILKAENPIGTYLIKNSKRNPKWKDCKKVEMKITSKQFIEDLKRFNIVPRKTHTYKFPEWMKSHPLRHHFIRGYFDGDGSFYSSLKKDGIRTVKQIGFNLRGTEDMLSAVGNIFNEELNLTGKTKEKTPQLSNGIHSLSYGGNRILEKIFSYMYKDATVYMQRKYDIGVQAKDLGDPRNFDEICSKEALIKLYAKRQSLEKVGKELEVSLAAVHKYVKKHNIKIKESTGSKAERFKTLLSKENIVEAYSKAGTVKGAARSLGVGATTFKRYMERHNISL